MRTLCMRYVVIAAAMFAAGCSQNPVYRQTEEPLPVAPIEQQRYLGLWHEQARLPNSFEQGCQRATAEYGVRADGLISVVNTCIDERGERRVARGRARPAAEAGEGKLKVSFFGPFWADYWVLDRGEVFVEHRRRTGGALSLGADARRSDFARATLGVRTADHRSGLPAG